MLQAIAFEMPEDVIAAREGLLAFARAEILPRHERHRELFEDPRRYYDESGRLSDETIALIREVRMTSAEAGYFQMCVPEALGGGGLGHLAYFVCWEALYHLCGPQVPLAMFALSHWAFGPSKLLEKLSPRAQAELLPSMMDGSKSMCFGLSEPGAGSDASQMQTRAQIDGDGWVINGRKIWTTNAPIADYCLLFAVTELVDGGTGITAFIVPTSAPGFELQRIVKMFGHIGGDESELRFEGLKVEPWQVVGEVGKGFAAALYGVSLGRIYNSARAIGYGRWALEMAFEYAKTRQSFGRPIAEHQGVSFPLAQSATELHAANLMGINAGALLDKGHNAIKELSMAKAYAVQAGVRVIDRAMQTHGAMGFTNEIGLTDAWEKVRAINVADGTNEILYRTIVQRMLKGDVDL
jgi:alkylation response protein AidB-like acyl-CoA dehydrogenase